MSIFWNMLQDHRFFELRDKADDVTKRVASLEKEMADLRDLMKKLLHSLEKHVGEDIDRDGHVGSPPQKQVAIKKPMKIVVKRRVINKKI